MSETDELKSILDRQHQLITGKMHDVSTYRGEQKQSLFDDLCRYLAAHEAAVQVSRHEPESRPPGKLAAAKSTHTDRDGIAQLIGELEGSAIDSTDFTTKFGELERLISSRGRAEELNVSLHANEFDVSRSLLQLKMVPGFAAGAGHSITMSAAVPYAELLKHSLAAFNVLPQDPTSDDNQVT